MIVSNGTQEPSLATSQEPTADALLEIEGALRRMPERADLRGAMSQLAGRKIERLLARGAVAQAELVALLALRCAVPDPQRFHAVRCHLTALLGIDLSQRPSARRWLVVRAWGAGFWAEIDHVLCQLLLAEMTCRTPIIHWGENSLYGGSPTRNGFARYFSAIGDLAALEAPEQDKPTGEKAAVGGLYPAKWKGRLLGGPDCEKFSGGGAGISALQLMGRSEAVLVSDYFSPMLMLQPRIPPWHPLHRRDLDEIYRSLITRYLQPQPALVLAAQNFVTTVLQQRPFVAVHLRGLDKVGEIRNLRTGHLACFAEVDALLGSEPECRVFVMTDDSDLLAESRSRYGDRLVSADVSRTRGTRGLHFEQRDKAPEIHGDEVMVDTLIALQANAFVGLGPSNLAAMVALLRQWQPGQLRLLGQSIHESFNLKLYDDLDKGLLAPRRAVAVSGENLPA